MNNIKKALFDFIKECVELKLTESPWNEYQIKQYSLLIWKYGSPFRLTGKGEKIVKTLLDDYWNGRKFSFKELMMVYELGFIKMSMLKNEKLRGFIEQIDVELKDRFELSLETSRGKLISNFIKKGFLQKNPDFNEDFLYYTKKAYNID